MPVEVLRDVKLWLDGFDLSGDMNAVALDYSAELEDATTFGKAGRVRRSGLKNMVVRHEGFWQAGPELVDEVLQARIGVADVPMSIAPNAGAEGALAYLLRTLLGEYAPGGMVGRMFAFSVSGEGSAGEDLVRGTVIHNATKTVTGVGTAFNVGAVAAGQKLYAALHVLAVAGTTPTLDVLVQSDDLSGFGSPLTRITFAQATARGSQWAAPVAGPITDAWLRVSYTIGGTGGPSFTFVVVIGIK